MTEKPNYQDKNWLIYQYTIEKLSTTDIGKICNRTPKTIWNWLIKYEISVRSSKEAQNTNKCKSKKREARKGKYTGKNAPFYGKHHSEDAKRKRSLAMQGENNPFYGKHHTLEARELMSKKRKGKSRSLEAIEKQIKTFKEKYKKGEIKITYLYGKDHPMYGKHHSNESIQKMSKTHKKRIESGEITYLSGKDHYNWNPNRAEVYAPYGENFYNEDLRMEKWDLQHGRDLFTGEKLKEGKKSHYHHIDYDKSNDDLDNHCWLTDSNHAKITGHQSNPTKSEYYKRVLQKNTILLKQGKDPKNWKIRYVKVFKQENLVQLKLDNLILKEEID